MGGALIARNVLGGSVALLDDRGAPDAVPPDGAEVDDLRKELAASRARELGFPADTNFDEIIRRYIEESGVLQTR